MKLRDETQDHVWQCQEAKNGIQDILNEAIQLADRLLVRETNPYESGSVLRENIISNIKNTGFFDYDNEEKKYTELFKGIIPCALEKAIITWEVDIKKREAVAISKKVCEYIVEEGRKRIWNERCEEAIDYERNIIGITCDIKKTIKRNARAEERARQLRNRGAQAANRRGRRRRKITPIQAL